MLTPTTLEKLIDVWLVVVSNLRSDVVVPRSSEVVVDIHVLVVDSKTVDTDEAAGVVTAVTLPVGSADTAVPFNDGDVLVVDEVSLAEQAPPLYRVLVTVTPLVTVSVAVSVAVSVTVRVPFCAGHSWCVELERERG